MATTTFKMVGEVIMDDNTNNGESGRSFLSQIRVLSKNLKNQK